jgi:RNA polymerase sigma-70 factor (family 1)
MLPGIFLKYPYIQKYFYFYQPIVMKIEFSDNELWDAVVSDSSRAFVLLYNRHWGKIYNSANYYLKNPVAAEEITHDVFVSLWEKRKSNKIEKFLPYLQAAARYQVYKYLKTRKINCTEYLDQFAETRIPPVYNSGINKLDYENMESRLTQLLHGLPPRCQEIFRLSRINSMSNQEIADKLNISKRTVENQITVALKALRTFDPQFLLAAAISFLISTGLL